MNDDSSPGPQSSPASLPTPRAMQHSCKLTRFWERWKWMDLPVATTVTLATSSRWSGAASGQVALVTGLYNGLLSATPPTHLSDPTLRYLQQHQKQRPKSVKHQSPKLFCAFEHQVIYSAAPQPHRKSHATLPLKPQGAGRTGCAGVSHRQPVSVAVLHEVVS